MRTLAVISVGLATVIGGCGRTGPLLTEYTAPGGEFRIALPSQPAVETRQDATVYRVADGDTTYMISRMACPPEFASDAAPDHLFAKFQEAGVQSLKGALQGHRDVASAGHAGREFVIHAVSKKKREPYEMTTRVFRVGPDVYLIHATIPRGDAAARSRSAAVLDSFTVLK